MRHVPHDAGDAERLAVAYDAPAHGVFAGPILPGEILVADRTDPGWIMLFPGALGLLVERGSLLSHSAIVARELRIPAVIAVDGLTTWLETGDVVELDGRAGTIRRISRGGESA